MVLKHDSQLLASPSGGYKGDTTVFGITLEGTLDVSGSSMDVHLVSTGGTTITVDCSGVSFSISGSNVEGVTDDKCVSDALSANDIKLVSFTYETDAFVLQISKSIVTL